MDVQSSTTIATMSEIVASVAGSNKSNSGTSNKRKRRSSIDEIGIQRPPAKKVFSPSACNDEFDSASDIENVSNESELYNTVVSPSKPTNQQHQRQKIDDSIRTSSSNTNSNLNNNINNNNNNSDKNNLNSHQLTTINSQNATLTPINHNTVGVHVSELTPQNPKKTEPYPKCIKCHSKNESRVCPLPLLSWANARDVWRFMCDKDRLTARDRTSQMLHKHQGLHARMRAILLDWLNEVCEVYKLHRETYYLALDYLDRYLSTQENISKTFLQLIGISCLFIAAKVEEIYPPKLSEFAYVTDGACTEEDILKQELIILSALKWQTSPITIIGWLGIYMQLNVNKRTPKNIIDSTPFKPVVSKDAERTPTHKTAGNDGIKSATAATNGVDDGFVFPQFSGMEYAQTAQLIDLCTLDVGIANYSYSVIAAAAISHTFNKKIAIKLSGLDWSIISPCSRWMEPYFQICIKAPRLVLSEKPDQFETKGGLGGVCPNIVTDDSHIIQAHTTNMDMFDEAATYREQTHLESSPAPVRTSLEHVCPPEGLLTPPDSSRKFCEIHPDSSHKE